MTDDAHSPELHRVQRTDSSTLSSSSSPREVRMAAQMLCQRLADLGALPPQEDTTTAPTARLKAIRDDLLHALTALLQIKNQEIAVAWNLETICVDDLHFALEKTLTRSASEFFRDLYPLMHSIRFTATPSTSETDLFLRALRDVSFSGNELTALPTCVEFCFHPPASRDFSDEPDEIPETESVFDTIADLRAFTNHSSKTLDTFSNIQQTLHTLLEHTQALTSGEIPMPWRALQRLAIQTFNALVRDADGLIACLLLDAWEGQPDTVLASALILSVELSRQMQIPHQAIPDIAVASILHGVWYCARPENLAEDNVHSMLRTLEQRSSLGPLSLPPLFLAIVAGDLSASAPTSSHTLQRSRLVRLVTELTCAWIPLQEDHAPSIVRAFSNVIGHTEDAIQHPKQFTAILFRMLVSFPPGTIIKTREGQHAVVLRNVRPHHRSFLPLQPGASVFHIHTEQLHTSSTPIAGITGSSELAQRARALLFHTSGT